MANTTGRVRSEVRIIPEELVASTTQSSIWADIYTRENTLAPEMRSVTNSESIVFSDTGKSSFGYLNGAKYYQEITTTSTNTLGTGVSYVEFIYFRHTGYRFNTFTDATCDTTNTDATVTCDASAVIKVGMRVSGTGITAGTTVASIGHGTEGIDVSSFELSAAASANNTNVTLTFYDHADPSTTANTADYIEIRGDADDGFVIAVLGPGDAMVLPLRSSAGWTTSADRVGSTNYFFQSVDPDDLSAGTNNIAMEFFAGQKS